MLTSAVVYRWLMGCQICYFTLKYSLMSLQIVSIIVFTVADKLVSGKVIMNSQFPCIYMSRNL